MIKYLGLEKVSVCVSQPTDIQQSTTGGGGISNRFKLRFGIICYITPSIFGSLKSIHYVCIITQKSISIKISLYLGSCTCDS